LLTSSHGCPPTLADTSLFNQTFFLQHHYSIPERGMPIEKRLYVQWNFIYMLAFLHKIHGCTPGFVVIGIIN